MAGEAFAELCEKMMVPGSARLERIWRMLCDEADARLVLAMPGTIPDLARKAGVGGEEAERRVQGLFHKGVAFEAKKPEGVIWRSPRHLIQMHDASVQWPEAPAEFYAAWNDFMAEEYPALLELMLSSGFPSFMRAIPASGTLGGAQGALPHEDVFAIIDAAGEIAVARCPCRLAMKKCDAPLQTCIQFNASARYNIKRGTGKKIDREEAKRIAADAEAHNLVHMVDNRAGVGNFLCNCCNDCCAIIVPYLKGGALRPILAPSRYTSRFAPGTCAMCALCEDVCPVRALKLDEEKGAVAVDAEACIGCGLCVKACPDGAFRLEVVRPPEFIPG